MLDLAGLRDLPSQLLSPELAGKTSDELIPRIYDKLRSIAAGYLDKEYRSDHTLQPTALVHEAFFKVRNVDLDELQDRSMLAEYVHPGLGQVRSVGPPVFVSGHDPVHRPGPELGADGESVLSEVGLDLEAQDALRAHPDLYARGPSGIALRIEGGRLSLGSLQVPGYGYDVDIRVDERTPLDAWRFPEA